MTPAEKKARELIATRTTEEIIDQFELTELIDDEDISTVRGWYMDELAKRNPAAFDAWIEAFTDSPRQFFEGVTG